MKAIIVKKYGSVDNFEMADIPVPPIRKGEVRIKILAASFNPVDYQIRKGLPESKLVTSDILGRDLSGVIDEVHEEVSDFKKGDEVYSYVAHLASSGTYTEYICVPSFLVAKKPLSLSHEEAAATPVAGITAWLALTKTKAQIAKSVFLTGGAGGVGSFVILFAKKFGVNNIVTTAGSSKSFYYLVQRLGISESRVLNYRNNNFVENTVDKKGYFDIAIDLVGGKILSACCSLLAIDGDLASATEIPTTNDFEVLFSKNASFHSIGTNAYSLSQNQFHHARYQQILNRITDLFDSGSISKPPVSVVGSFGLQTVRQAHIMLENNLAQGKLVMNF